MCNSKKQGLDNLAYVYGSQSELQPPAKCISRVTFRILGLSTEPQAREVETRISILKGVLGVSLSMPRKLAKVDYDTSVITSKEIVLELQNTGHSVEAAVQIRVDGMHCQSCVRSIEDRISGLPGVTRIQVSLQNREAVIVFQPLIVEQQELRVAIENMGFDAILRDDLSLEDINGWQLDILTPSSQTVNIWIVGMTCNSCVQSIEGRISQMAGVLSICVSLMEEKGTISFDPRQMDPEKLRVAIEDMGFDASLQGKYME